MSEPTSRRKDAHLDLCANEEVEPEGASTLLEHVRLVHDALPDLSRAEIDLSMSWLGKRLSAPLIITGMTGGSERAGQVNRDLAEVAERTGIAFGLGSQRAMSEQDELSRTYRVREVAPNTVVLGNIGLAQALSIGPAGCRALMERIGADGLCLHLNAAQELTQPEGDRDFRGGLDLVRALASELGDRFVVKETGCGISPSVARRLVDAGVKNIDVSGAGGTSWVRVESLRTQGDAARLGEEFSTWGVPTAAAVAGVVRELARHSNSRATPTTSSASNTSVASTSTSPSARTMGVTVIGSGGIRSGLEVAKVLALGANLAGMALPVFRAQQRGGVAEAVAEVTHLIEGLARTMLLTGSRTVEELQSKPKVVTGPLKDWLGAFSQT